MSNAEATLPPLAPAGQGLPPVEAWVARHVLFPLATQQLTRSEAITKLLAKGQKALQLTQALPVELAHQRQLIPRFMGIEDSSRYWSVAMTLKHLLITGEAMASLTECLAQGQTSSLVVRIEDVKPDPTLDLAALMHDYSQFLAGYEARMSQPTLTQWQRPKHQHPWFGEINPHQWLCLNTLHHGIHLKQLHLISKALTHHA